MPEEEIGKEVAPDTQLPSRSKAAEEVADALARVHGAVTDAKESDLQGRVEVAIETIDDASGALGHETTEKLNEVADALEEALDELESGKVAKLQPVIEQARTIIPEG